MRAQEKVILSMAVVVLHILVQHSAVSQVTVATTGQLSSIKNTIINVINIDEPTLLINIINPANKQPSNTTVNATTTVKPKIQSTTRVNNAQRMSTTRLRTSKPISKLTTRPNVIALTTTTEKPVLNGIMKTTTPIRRLSTQRVQTNITTLRPTIKNNKPSTGQPQRTTQGQVVGKLKTTLKPQTMRPIRVG